MLRQVGQLVESLQTQKEKTEEKSEDEQKVLRKFEKWIWWQRQRFEMECQSTGGDVQASMYE